MNAIVWQDVRTAGAVAAIERAGGGPTVREKTGLPPATYFSATKIQWVIQNVDAAREAVAAGRACCGTIDSWLVWNLTGGPKGGRHITDVTNASRTMLMDLRTLSWDDELLAMFAVPAEPSPRSARLLGPSVTSASKARVRAALPWLPSWATSTRP